MKALVVGGTTGFGAALVAELSATYEVVTVGRSGEESANHYVCDVTNLPRWQQVLRQIRTDHPDIELVICAVGYARLQSPSSLAKEDWQRTAVANTTYVKVAYRMLREVLAQRHGCFIAIGSRWSSRHDCDQLLPYIAAKRRLRCWVEGLARRQLAIRFVHCAVPQMDTPQYSQVVGGLADAPNVPRHLFSETPVSSESVAQLIATAISEWRRTKKPIDYRIIQTLSLVPAEADVA